MLHVLNGIQTMLIAVILWNIGQLPRQPHAGHDIPTPPAETSQWQQPLRLRIPARGIDATVRPVGLTHEGKVEVPAHAFTVGWYRSGAMPGDRGNAVLVGHRDTTLGTPGIFWALADMHTGDIIEVETEQRTLEFRVTKTEEYPFDQAPLEHIFGTTDGRHLNLITCAGDWMHHTYDKRLVVFAKLHRTEKTHASLAHHPSHPVPSPSLPAHP